MDARFVVLKKFTIIDNNHTLYINTNLTKLYKSIINNMVVIIPIIMNCAGLPDLKSRTLFLFD